MPGTCYLAVDGHRLDDLKPYLFVTSDYGATWKSIVNNLPKWGTVNVVREDAKNKDLLFVGTEYGLYVSLNGGAEWKPFMSGMPTMRVDDILVHPRDNDLIVGTHGRGIYILDDITPLQQMSQKVMDSDAHLFEVRPGTIWQNDHAARPLLGRREALPRRESGAGHGDQLLPEVCSVGRRETHDLRLHRESGAQHRRHE